MALQVPEYIRTLVPYLPGKPIEETQREFKIKKVIKLASNENPLGPSPKAKKAIQAYLNDLHRYPDGSGFHLKSTLSKHLNIAPQSLILGNGSNEIIDFIVRTYCLAGDAVVTQQAAFVAYKICAQIHGVKTVEIPFRNSDLKPDLEEMATVIKKNEKVKVVFIANPNNPTGNYFSSKELRKFISELSRIRGGSVVLVLDYAYWEYVTAKDLPDPIQLAKEYRNTIILRTFSKVYGLGGLRVGYGISVPEILSDLEKVRQPFNVSSLGLVGAQAALLDTAFVARAQKTNLKGMRFWEKNLSALNIPFWHSQGNFILADVQAGLGKKGMEIHQACLEKGVIFRPVANYGMPHALRISIGTPEENEMAVQALGGKSSLKSVVRKKK